MTYKLTIFGKPQPQGSTRAFVPKGWRRAVITSTNKNLKPYRATVSATAYEYMIGKEMISRPKSVTLRVQFYLARPASLPKKTKAHAKKPDLSKLVRALEDGLTGIVYEDDSQIDNIEARKCYGLPERTEVEVFESADVPQ